MDRKRLIGVLLFLVMITTNSLAADIHEFHVSQAWLRFPSITGYLHVLSEEGVPVLDLKGTQLTATLNEKPLSVKKIEPFNPTADGVAYIFLVDISKSLSASQFMEIKKAMSKWIDGMTDKDRAAVLVFGTDVKMLQDFTEDKSRLNTVIGDVGPVDNNTQLHLGLVKAMDLGRRKDPGLPTRRAIIILSDGHDDFAGGTTRPEVLDQMQVDPTPIYAIGFGRKPMTQEKTSFLKSLGEFARMSGGMYFASGGTSLADIYAAVHRNIDNVWAVSLGCDTCKADGGVYRLQVSLVSGTKTMSDGLNIRLLPDTIGKVSTKKSDKNEEKTPLHPRKWYMNTGYIVAGIIFLTLIMIGLIWIRKRQTHRKDMNKESLIDDGSDIIMPVAIPEPDSMPTQTLVKTDLPETKKIRLVRMGSKREQNPVTELEIADSIVIGRNKSTSQFIIADDDEVSVQHCELISMGNDIYLRDKNSTNGTLVNGVPFSGMFKLKNGDLILVGRTELRILF